MKMDIWEGTDYEVYEGTTSEDTRGTRARGHEGFNIRWLPCSVCVCVCGLCSFMCRLFLQRSTATGEQPEGSYVIIVNLQVDVYSNQMGKTTGKQRMLWCCLYDSFVVVRLHYTLHFILSLFSPLLSSNCARGSHTHALTQSCAHTLIRRATSLPLPPLTHPTSLRSSMENHLHSPLLITNIGLYILSSSFSSL